MMANIKTKYALYWHIQQSVLLYCDLREPVNEEKKGGTMPLSEIRSK